MNLPPGPPIPPHAGAGGRLELRLVNAVADGVLSDGGGAARDFTPSACDSTPSAREATPSA
eukprot:821327-Prorocentrum_minimum.AAC.2